MEALFVIAMVVIPAMYLCRAAAKPAPTQDTYQGQALAGGACVGKRSRPVPVGGEGSTTGV